MGFPILLVTLHFAWYNFVRVHNSLRITRWRRGLPITYGK